MQKEGTTAVEEATAVEGTLAAEESLAAAAEAVEEGNLVHWIIR